MSEFTPITSQEQLNEVIGKRLEEITAREERKAAEKYADYNDLKSQVASMTEQLQKQTETINGHKAEVDDLNAKLHAYETASVKTAVALELGLPYQMASRLNGEDEDAIRADAHAMVKLIGASNQPAPLGSAGQASGKDTRDQFADFVTANFNG